MSAIAAATGVRSSTGMRALMPSFTFAATAQAALWAGLEPLLADVDDESWHLDATALEQIVRDRSDIALVLAVSSFGTPPPSDTRMRWEAACTAAGTPLVIDSAAGFGAVAEDGVPVGAGGDIEVVSFHATKPFAIGEGGAVFTRRRDLLERVELATNFGLRPDRSLPFAMGLNGKMSELHAATALAVLDRIDEILEARRGAVRAIRPGADPGLGWQRGAEHSTWQFLPVRFSDEASRRRTIETCANDLEVRRYYTPLHTLEAFEGIPRSEQELAVTDDLHLRLLCLPMANDLSPEEIATIARPLQPASATGDAGRRVSPGSSETTPSTSA